ncbi:YybH family protein [Massilia niastensis]|uniref:YybH family protein n=1 Tax=Massilia niastensis TaxID=544911 RepID=UPI0003794DC9|nr:nuclear transport factor 2 family protein [Massilia niastensis]
MGHRSISLLAACLVLVAAAGNARVSPEDLKKQVADSERAFAATMKARDFDGFTRFLADEAIFMSGEGALRGKRAVSQAWRKYYDKPEAPFSWEPEEVEVLESGTLAYSGGPVYDQKGRKIGRFNSIWRLEAPGRWKVVFDRGSDFCDCKK